MNHTRLWEIVKVLGIVECQNIPPQNMLLAQNDYFELKATEKTKIQEKLSAHPPATPICLKAVHTFTKLSSSPHYW